MKEKLCLKKTLFACLSFLFLSFACAVLLPSSPTHALSISSTNSDTFSSSTKSAISIDGGSYYNSSYTNTENNNRYYSVTYNSTFDVRDLNLNIRPTSAPPANSILNFNISWIFSGSNTFQKPYFLSSNFINVGPTITSIQVLNYNCSESESYYGNSNRYSLSCDVTIYFNSEFSGALALQTNLHAGNDGSTSAVLVLASISRYNYFVVNYDSLSENDKDWLSDDFLDAMTDAVAEGERQANEEVKQETQTQTQQSESTSNTQGSSSETQGQTLLQAFSSFVSAITNVQPAQNCDLDIDFTGYAPGLQTTVDLCSLSPPSGLTFIGSILLILFCVPLSISTVRKLISLFRSFQT